MRSLNVFSFTKQNATIIVRTIQTKSIKNSRNFRKTMHAEFNYIIILTYTLLSFKKKIKFY